MTKAIVGQEAFRAHLEFLVLVLNKNSNKILKGPLLYLFSDLSLVELNHMINYPENSAGLLTLLKLMLGWTFQKQGGFRGRS